MFFRSFQISIGYVQGRRQKISRGGRGATEIISKIAKKTPKNSTIKPLPGGANEKKSKNSTISLYLLYLYHV